MDSSRPYANRKINHYPPSAQIHQYSEGQLGNATRSQLEQDMEIGYEDKHSPLTLEALEKKFRDEIIKLAKEESDADDAENARHRERKMEISNQYQEKLSSLRTLQAKKREEFLYNDTQERINQYHHHQRQQQKLIPNNYPTDRREPDPRGYGPRHHPTDTINHRGYGLNQYPTDTSLVDHRGYGAPASIESQHRGYTAGSYEPYRERSPYHQVQRNEQETLGKVPIPQGRVYNNTRAHNF